MAVASLSHAPVTALGRSFSLRSKMGSDTWTSESLRPSSEASSRVSDFKRRSCSWVAASKSARVLFRVSQPFLRSWMEAVTVLIRAVISVFIGVFMTLFF